MSTNMYLFSTLSNYLKTLQNNLGAFPIIIEFLFLIGES